MSKCKITNVKNDLIKDKLKQSRIITGEILVNKKKIKLINIYVPNGNPIDSDKYEYKKSWLTSFVKKIKKELSLNPNLILSGDFNIIPEEIDVYDYNRYKNDALFKLEIRKKFRELINLGFNDVYRYFNKSKKEYTFDIPLKPSAIKVEEVLVKDEVRRDKKTEAPASMLQMANP